jgi:hypothetical protein
MRNDRDRVVGYLRPAPSLLPLVLQPDFVTWPRSTAGRETTRPAHDRPRAGYGDPGDVGNGP